MIFRKIKEIPKGIRIFLVSEEDTFLQPKFVLLASGVKEVDRQCLSRITSLFTMPYIPD